MDDTVPALFRRSMAVIFLSFDCCFAFLILQQNYLRTLCLGAFVARFAVFCNCRTVVDPGSLLLLARNIVFFNLKLFVFTVLLISTARFYVDKLLLHHYKNDLAHISDRCSSVIEMYLSEI